MKITWDKISQEQIDDMLNETIEQIFIGYDLTTMTKYEKRKRIYEYMIENKKYNYEYFNGILKNYSETSLKKSFPRCLMEEFLEPLVSDTGICNGFSQIYKLLLEKVDIYSICINCMIRHENIFVGHQLNLVHDEETNSFSFDDITFGIINQTIDEYFDYDNPEETEEMQGCAPIYDDIKWMIVGDGLINFYAKREKNPIKKPIKIEITDFMLRELSDFKSKGINIKSLKKMTVNKTL